MSTGLWNTSEIGKATTGYSLGQLTNPTTTTQRVVTTSTDGTSTVTSAGDTSKFTSATANSTLGKQDFLNLLVAQMKNQDPLSPQDNTAYVAQLAQFSTLETAQNEETAVEGLSTNMTAFMKTQNANTASTVNASSTNLLGKTVRVVNSDVNYLGSPMNFNIQLNDSVSSAYLQVKNSSGAIIATRSFATDGTTQDATCTWDGKGDDGSAVASGDYTASIVDSTGKTSEGYVYVSGKVTGLRYSSAGSNVVIDGKSYSTNNLMSVDSQS